MYIRRDLMSAMHSDLGEDEASVACPTRDVRRRTFNIGRLGSGDWVIFAATFALFIALIVNWWTGGAGAVNSVALFRNLLRGHVDLDPCQPRIGDLSGSSSGG